MKQLSLFHLKPQTALVLKHLEDHMEITPVIAAAIYKVRSLPKRISELKQAGYKIRTTLCKDATGQRYARYSF